MVTKNLDHVCKLLRPELLDIISEELERNPTRGEKSDDWSLQSVLRELADSCGYERVKNKWVRFPEQKETLESLTHAGIPDTYEIIEEHEDGDLVIKLAKQGKAMVTTDGDIYYYSQHVRV